MKPFHKKCTPLLTLLILSLYPSCTNYTIPGDDLSDDPGNLIAGGCSAETISYEGDIVTILENNCIACHNSGSAAGGYDYSDYDALLISIANGSFMGSIEGRTGYSPMPPANTLNECAINSLKVWIGSVDLDGISTQVLTPGTELNSSCDPDTVYFRNTILPLLVSSCGTSNCHDQESHRDGIILTDYRSIINTGKIKPGNPGDSELYESLTDDEDDLMPPPPMPALSEDQISAVKKWIRQGALDNECQEDCETVDVTFSGNIWPVMETYCTGCHSNSNPSGGVVIENYTDVVTLAEKGTLMGTITYESGYHPMPPNAQLDPCRITQLEQWIDLNYPE